MVRKSPTHPTAEHGFPLWLTKFLPGDEGDDVTHTVRDGATEAVEHQWAAKQLDFAARKVCERCNTGWMNDLENLARPHLVPLIEGQRRVLDAPAQRIVAAWAVKTALALSLANPGKRPVATHHYRAMAEMKDRPPPKSLVWIGAYSGWRHASHFPEELTLSSSSGDVDGYAATLTVARLVLQVVGHSHNDDVSITKLGSRAHMAAQIWPVGGLTHWPLPIVMDDDALAVLRNSWN